jgi:hypothetical protein
MCDSTYHRGNMLTESSLDSRRWQGCFETVLEVP